MILFYKFHQLQRGDSSVGEYTKKFYELLLRARAYESKEALTFKYRASLPVVIQYKKADFRL